MLTSELKNIMIICKNNATGFDDESDANVCEISHMIRKPPSNS